MAKVVKMEEYAELIRVLEREMVLVKQLLEHARSIQEALVNSDNEALSQLLMRQGELAEELHIAEHERKEIVSNIAQASGRDSLTLSQIAQAAPDNYRLVLEHAKRHLYALLEELYSVNDTNALLIAQALAFNDMWAQLLLGRQEPSPVYTKDGRMKEGNSGVVDVSL